VANRIVRKRWVVAVVHNAARELSKVLGRAIILLPMELLRCIKFLIDTKDKGLKIKPKKEENWKFTVYSDSDWAGDKDTRKSVGSYIIFLNDIPIAWRSKAPKVVRRCQVQKLNFMHVRRL
jgi:hypothetical protein